MPNWCANNVEFHNDDVAEVAKLEAHLKFLDEKDKSESHLVEAEYAERHSNRYLLDILQIEKQIKELESNV